MGGNISIHHFVSLPVWGNIVSPSVVSEDLPVDPFIGSLDCVCRGAIFRLFYPPDFASEERKIT